ncbi:uncharacterized protein LOC124932669 [Impatiens glandulifera]|uniref:uncharacterized protein LOC124932669 n=1 Tax=Impatiens glandulifera TaxID=253017 RepID=UPI001FB10D2E|nr:uncharacterized protein LOC124932669 [Impatiens glandulifera]
MDELEPPECPVCLQSYDQNSTIPRVLACGHSACDVCIDQLPHPFPFTIRCPACTQLVNYPNPQGASALPKNIDLLRLASIIPNPDHQNNQNPSKSPVIKQPVDFIPGLWSHAFYLSWKGWVLPEDALVVEVRTQDPFFSVFHGRILKKIQQLARYSLKGDEKLSLLRLAGPFSEVDDSKLRYSYTAKIMSILYGMNLGERDELSLLLTVSNLKGSKTCKVYGIWYSEDDQFLYMVSESYNDSLLEKKKKRNGDWKKESAGEGECSLNLVSFSMMGMEICEAVHSLHIEGLFCGCFDPSCFRVDGFGHVYIDLNEVLALGRRVVRLVRESESLNDNVLRTPLAFISPQLLQKLLRSEDLETGSLSGYDVWSTSCLVLWLFMGNSFSELVLDSLGSISDGSHDFKASITVLVENLHTSLNVNYGLDLVWLKEILFKCLELHTASQTSVIDIWKCIRELIVQNPDEMATVSQDFPEEEGTSRCLLLGELCKIPREEIRAADPSVAEEKSTVNSTVGSNVKCIELKGHLDCITGLAVGGGFLFSISYDKTVILWSLQDFSQVHTFRGHEQKIMAVVYVDYDKPLCVTGDSGGAICIWNISNVPFSQEPIKRLQEEKDWRYSGIHALATSGTGLLYTGSGDKSIKAWSLRDYTISCVMNGHKSVVSTLVVCDGVLYSGSWDGTVRLWCMSDHSPLAVLGEDIPGNVTSVLSLAVHGNFVVASHENGCVKIWSDGTFLESIQAHNGAVFSISMEGKWLFTGGWDKVVIVQELLGDEVHKTVASSVGSIACNSVITSLLYQQGKLLVGQADRIIKVYCCKL